MIVFFDGVDGSGKTTLIRRLDRALTEHGRQVKVTPPLWQYLPDIAAAADFPAWVTTTEGVAVAVALLDAMTRRLRALSQTTAHPDRIVLVDRGPKTVVASAQAHARLASRHYQTTLAEARQRCTVAVNAVLAVCPGQAIELYVDDGAHPAVLRRLHAIQTVEPRYRDYLDAFQCQMAAAPAWPGIPTLRLHALDPMATNLARAAAAVLGEA